MVGNRGAGAEAAAASGAEPRAESETLIPPFDPAALAMDIEQASERPTLPPPFEGSAYARILEEHIESDSSSHDAALTVTVESRALTPSLDSTSHASTGTLGRTMYGSYLSSDYPEALVLAERVLEREPDHALARLVLEGCLERLENPRSEAPRLVPSSVVRLKRQPHELDALVDRGRLETDVTSQIVLASIDGVADVAMLAALAGIPRPEALTRLHALLELDVLEVVNA